MDKNNFKINFIGIGAPRAGTTWIYEILKAHPEICVSKPKETYFFNLDEKYNQGINYYATFFKSCPKHKIKGEYCNYYLRDETSAQRIQQYFPDVKLIVCLRNPIERAYSHYLYHEASKYYAAHQMQQSFEQALKERAEYIQAGYYAQHIKKYLKYFDSRQILILIYEDLKRDPQKFAQKIYHFLGVNKNIKPKYLEKIINPAPASGFKMPFLNPTDIDSMGRKFRKIKGGWRLFNLLKKLKINRFANLLVRLNRRDYLDKKPMQKPTINPTTRKYLQDLYTYDIQELEKLVQRDLNFWK